MDKNLINMSELENVLSELGNIKYTEDMMTDEMKASQQRCTDYIEKHIDKE